MSLPARIAAFLLACLICAGVGCRLGLTIKQGEWDASVRGQLEAQTTTAQVIAARLADMTTAQAKTTERVIHEVEKPVYRDCVLPDDGRRLLNDAINGASAEPAGGDGVQATAE